MVMENGKWIVEYETADHTSFFLYLSPLYTNNNSSRNNNNMWVWWWWLRKGWWTLRGKVEWKLCNVSLHVISFLLRFYSSRCLSIHPSRSVAHARKSTHNESSAVYIRNISFAIQLDTAGKIGREIKVFMCSWCIRFEKIYSRNADFLETKRKYSGFESWPLIVIILYWLSS